MCVDDILTLRSSNFEDEDMNQVAQSKSSGTEPQNTPNLFYPENLDKQIFSTKINSKLKKNKKKESDQIGSPTSFKGLNAINIGILKRKKTIVNDKYKLK